MQFEHYLERGTPHAPDSFLDMGEWFKFKNLDDFFQDGGFARQSVFDELEAQLADSATEKEDLEEKLDDSEKAFRVVEKEFKKLSETIEQFDIVEFVRDNPGTTVTSLVEELDKIHQQWYNQCSEVESAILKLETELT